MRLLVVGHSYVTAFAQAKYVAMKQMDPGLRLRLVTPPETTHVFRRYRREVASGLHTDEIVPLRAWFGRSHMSYLLDPLELATQLRQFAPEHIHIEEDPHSLVGLETVVLARLFCHETPISFFVWDNLWRTPRFPLSLLKPTLTRLCLSRTSLVVCGNTEGRDLLRKKGYLGPSVVLPQVGLDPEDYVAEPPAELYKHLHGGEGRVLIGYAGRLVAEKGIVLLLEALSQIVDLPWRLVLIGSGPLRDVIRQWQSRFGERLICLDAVDHQCVPVYLKCLDVFVLPSYKTPGWKEQFGLTMAQAMMAGVACLGSSSGAIPEVLGSGGCIFEEGSVEGLRSALTELIRSGEVRGRAAQRARTLALQRYTNRTIAEGYLTAFSTLCLRRSGGNGRPYVQ